MALGSFRWKGWRETVAVAVMIVLATAVIEWSWNGESSLVRRADNFVYDAFMTWQIGTHKPHFAPIIIDIDERSLAERGQWPWPRYLVADLVERLCENGVRAVGLDMILSEADRTSPVHLVGAVKERFGVELGTAGLPEDAWDNDAYLARRIANLPVVVGMVPLFASNAQLSQENLPRKWDKEPCLRDFPGAKPAAETIRTAQGAILPRKCFSDAAPVGLILPDENESDVVRGIFLVTRVGDMTYSGLALRTLMRAEGKEQINLINNARGFEGIRIPGVAHVRVAGDGFFFPYFRGGRESYPYFSATDVLAGRIDREFLAGRIAFVGSSATGLNDLRTTSVAGNVPGVEIHATVLDNILSGTSVLRPTWEASLQMVGIPLVAAVTVALCLLCPWWIYLVLSAMLAGWLGACWMWFLKGTYFSPVPMGLTILVVGSFLLFHRFFTEMGARKALRQDFSCYVAPAVVDRIVKRGAGLLSGETRRLSILFTDIRGFTSLSEHLSPEQVVSLLNAYFTPMTRIVKDSGGTVDKFIGDALMAFWNAPLDVADHAEVAVAAALSMQRELDVLRSRFLEEFGVEIHMGAGVNTGEVHVGNMGARDRFNYTCIGDEVNLASRLESLCKRYGTGVIVSDATVAACGEAYEFLLLDRIRVKGREKAVDIYVPLGKREDSLQTGCRNDGAGEGDSGRDEASNGIRDVRLWEESLAFYLEGDFARAAAGFEVIADREGRLSKAAFLHLGRCRSLAVDPPDGWDGVWTYDSK